MRRILLIALTVLSCASLSLAQSWEPVGEGELELNCDLIELISEDYGDEPLARRNGDSATLSEFFSSLVPSCESSSGAAPGDTLFNVRTGSSVNLRDCANTTCSKVGVTADGDILDVVGEDGDWYEIKYGSGTAFIAGWLTERLPDAVIETGEAHFISGTNCTVVPDASRASDMDINVIITGDRKGDVTVDITQPDHDNPMRVERQLDKTFIDTGDSYILQTYYWNTWWQTGLYKIDVEIDGQHYTLGWKVTSRDKINLYVQCE